MKQILILSGKGGTGKTTMVAAFIELLNAKAFADCDVDAPNLHLLMNMNKKPETTDFYGMEKAIINEAECIGCGKCQSSCRFDAIDKINTANGIKYRIDTYACEGCSVCQYVCPVNAVSLGQNVDGEMQVYKEDRVFSTATLKMGSGNSGKLVTEVKKNMKNNVDEKSVDIAVIDGSPGIGCPVISSVSGVSLILLVTEPTVSGISDMKRVVEIAAHFKIPVAICTNKYNVNENKTNEIKAYAKKNNIDFVGVIPYDKQVAYATNQGKSIMNVESIAGEYIEKVFANTINLLNM